MHGAHYCLSLEHESEPEHHGLLKKSTGSKPASSSGQLLQSFFFGFDALDAVTLGGVSAALMLVGVAACLIPGWSAMRANPLDSLRHE